MYVNPEILRRGRDNRALFLFLHCQRTGGSSLQRWLQTVFPVEQIFSVRTVENYVQWHRLEDFSVLDPYKLVAGFANYRQFPLSRPLVALANVRHPFYRIVSVYRMSRTSDSHFLHEVAVKSSFEDFYLQGRRVREYYFHNLMSRRIGGEPDGDAAIAAIRADFGLVATTNHLHEATNVLIEQMGWDVDPIETNGAPPDEVNYKQYDASPLRDEIIENNLHDLRLFEFVNSSARRETPIALRRSRAILSDTDPQQANAVGRRDSENTGTIAISAAARAAASRSRRPAAAPRESPLADLPGVPDRELDTKYREYLKSHPGSSYSQFYVTQVASKVKSGHRHNSLGPNIMTGDVTDFWETGRKQAERWMEYGGVTPESRVVEYGCGSLRLAAHFIKRLAPAHFFGLDIISDFFEHGKQHLGQSLLDEKKPILRVIGPESVEEARTFDPSFVFSHAVMIHVHPDDVATYFRNLTRLAARPGAILAFNAMLHDPPVRYNNLGWAWPEKTILDYLPQFEAVDIRRARNTTAKGDYNVRGVTFTMRRKGA